MIFPAEQRRPVEYWDSLKTEEQLKKAFENIAGNELGRLTGEMGLDPKLPGYYLDNEFSEVAAKLRPLAKEMIPIFEDILKHIPYPYNKDFFKKKAESVMDGFVGAMPMPMGVAAYTLFLMAALDDDYIARIGRGFTIPETRAQMRAYNRFLNIKKIEDTKRAEFEKTAEYRLQRMELKLHLRDHIDYPK